EITRRGEVGEEVVGRVLGVRVGSRRVDADSVRVHEMAVRPRGAGDVRGVELAHAGERRDALTVHVVTVDVDIGELEVRLELLRRRDRLLDLGRVPEPDVVERLRVGGDVFLGEGGV